MKRLALLVLAVLLILPAGAHIGDFSEGKSFTAGPYGGTLMPGDAYTYSGRAGTLRMLLAIKEGAGYKSPSNTTEVAWRATLGGSEASGTMRSTLLGQWDGPATLPRAGQWSVNVTLNGPSGFGQATFPFQVYPDLGYRIKSATPTLDPPAGQVTTLRFNQSWYDPSLRGKSPPPTDLTLSMEKWTDDHKTMLSKETVPLHVEGSEWVGDYRFPSTGMFHLRFSSVSGGFNETEMPIQHVIAVEAPPFDWRPILQLALGAVVIGGLVAAVVMWRNQRRHQP